MAAAMANVTNTEEGGNFFSRMAWYYQMAILLALVAILIYAADAMMFSDTRAETAKIDSQAQALKAKNAQASIIRQNLAAAEETLRKKQEEMDGLRDLLPDQVEITRKSHIPGRDRISFDKRMAEFCAVFALGAIAEVSQK